jgi:large repetitive protein
LAWLLVRWVARARPGAEPEAGVSDEDVPAAACSVHSFVGVTGVLLADGRVKPIARVRVGDRVVDAVPGSAVMQTHTVQRVIVTRTDHDFVDVSVKSSLVSRLGKVVAVAAVALTAAATLSTPATASTLTTTFHHPFYDVTRSTFVDADNLKAGDQLQTTNGNTATITAVRLFHATTVTYDLTINGLHTYYVQAGYAPVWSIIAIVLGRQCRICVEPVKLAPSETLPQRKFLLTARILICSPL